MYPKNSSRGCIKLTTARLTIRDFNPNDLDALISFESQPGMRQFEQGIANRTSAERYLKKAIQRASVVPRTDYYLGITLTPNDNVIGRISLASQNLAICEWEIGWAVRNEDWGKGYASEAAQQMLAFAFET
jgi:Acetyltransferases, including N-acetylases of ribosomal proteins